MRGGQLLDFILLHILKIFGCVTLGFFAKIWLFDILYILNRCFFEPLIPLHEILQFVCNTHHSSFWHNSLCIISFHSSEINLQLLDLTPSEHTSYPDRGRKWSEVCIQYVETKGVNKEKNFCDCEVMADYARPDQKMILINQRCLVLKVIVN